MRDSHHEIADVKNINTYENKRNSKHLATYKYT